MSKFLETTYTSQKEILKYDHYVAHAVTVSTAGVSADRDSGKYIVPAGTVVGGTSKSALLNPSERVVVKNTPSVAASITFGTNANGAVTFTAVTPGTTGNAIKVAFLDPSTASAALSVDIAADTINVYLATNTSSALTTTAAQVVTAVNAHLAARTVVTAAKSGTGATVVAAKAATALAGGKDGNAKDAEGILLWDVDVTNGDAAGTMVVHGFINRANLPTVVCSEAQAVLKNITFVS